MRIIMKYEFANGNELVCNVLRKIHLNCNSCIHKLFWHRWTRRKL